MIMDIKSFIILNRIGFSFQVGAFAWREAAERSKKVEYWRIQFHLALQKHFLYKHLDSPSFASNQTKANKPKASLERS